MKNEKLKRYRDANTTMIEVSSDSEDDEEYQSPKKLPMPSDAKELTQMYKKVVPSELITNWRSPKKLDRRHICGIGCVSEFESNDNIFEFDPLKRPLLAGWKRNITGFCYYIAPCGRTFSTIETTHKYLLTTKSKLTIDCFTFSLNIDCMAEVITVSANNNIDKLNNVSEKLSKETNIESNFSFKVYFTKRKWNTIFHCIENSTY